MTSAKTLPSYDPTLFEGDKIAAFETELHEALLDINPTGEFTETLTAVALAAWK